MLIISKNVTQIPTLFAAFGLSETHHVSEAFVADEAHFAEVECHRAAAFIELGHQRALMVICVLAAFSTHNVLVHCLGGS